MSYSVWSHRQQPTRLPVPGILQARTLEWVAISFSSAWKWKVKGKSLSRIRFLATPWTAAYQAPPSMGFSRQEYWSGVPLPYLDISVSVQFSRSPVSDSLWPHESQHARPPCPSPTNNFPLNWNWIFNFVVLDLFFFQFSVSQQILLILCIFSCWKWRIQPWHQFPPCSSYKCITKFHRFYCQSVSGIQPLYPLPPPGYWKLQMCPL